MLTPEQKRIIEDPHVRDTITFGPLSWFIGQVTEEKVVYFIVNESGHRVMDSTPRREWKSYMHRHHHNHMEGSIA